MAFKLNYKYQQESLFDRYDTLPVWMQHRIDESWAKSFADYVFPAIDESRFAPLYSDNPASRPNTPVNVIVGAMTLKSLFNQSDEQLLDRIFGDIYYQVALHLTDYVNPPLNSRTFGRFRERLYIHQLETGEDLLADEMKHLSEVFSKFLELNSNIKRMDSMQIATKAKSMSRLEIIYTVNANAVALLHKTKNDSLIPANLMHYLSEDDHNKVIYRCEDDESTNSLEKVIKEAAELKEIMNDELWQGTTQYQHLIRVLGEQANFDENGNYTAKPNKEISPSSMQNPSDPDATFRMKAGQGHKGYVGNFVETVGEDGLSLITDFDFRENTYSDSAFAKDQILKHDKNDPVETYIADGAYGGIENQQLAEEHGIMLVTTALTGKTPDVIFADFQFNEDGTEVLKCPAGYEPEKSTYQKSNESVRVLMSKCHCENCPHREQCKAHEQKKNYVINTSHKMKERASYLKKLSSEEYIQLTRKRNAVESIPSVLRRRFGADRCPHFGIIKTGWTYALAVGGYNIMKLIKYLPRVREKSTLFPAPC